MACANAGDAARARDSSCHSSSVAIGPRHVGPVPTVVRTGRKRGKTTIHNSTEPRGGASSDTPEFDATGAPPCGERYRGPPHKAGRTDSHTRFRTNAIGNAAHNTQTNRRPQPSPYLGRWRSSKGGPYSCKTENTETARTAEREVGHRSVPRNQSGGAEAGIRSPGQAPMSLSGTL